MATPLYSPQSEASKLLEAALQQMDGIIQGAKFEMPGFLDTPSPVSNGHRGNTNGSFESPSLSVSEALRQLRRAISQAPPSGSGAAVDTETRTFLARWLKNNPSPKAWSSDMSRGSEDADEAEDNLRTQLVGKARRIAELEQMLDAKKEQLLRTEQALERELSRSKGEGTASPGPSELGHWKSRCAALEVENEELRRICSGNRTPKYLPISPLRPRRAPALSDSSPDDDVSPTLRKGPVGFDEANAVDLNSSITSSGTNRPPRGLKRILGKIKRSNSGGELLETNGAHHRHRPTTPEFRRGGTRATVGGRLGSARANEGPSSASNKRPITEWNVDMICTWLECLGLGSYCPEVQKTIGTGAQLAAMSMADLETKLNMKSGLHRKKLFLAMSARKDPSRSDPEGALDYQWVLRWLDDVGLPQYKDSFLEARIDGRVLNILTVDELITGLKVTNQLHHLSIRRGIQVLREHNFDPNCLKRRAVAGEVINAKSVALWTTHRVMEWIGQVDLAEYAPNLRGSGVHGGLLVFEPKFGDGLFAALLAIPLSKTLLRRHLSIHFKELVGREVMQEKRSAEQDSNPLTPTSKAKAKQGQFTLKRKKSKSQIDCEDLVCPFEKK